MKVANGNITITKYWDIPYCPVKERLNWTPDEISEKIQELLHDAIRIRLRADVPVGAYLSGGLDSSGVTASVVKNFNNDVKTFGIRFEEEGFDEGEQQNQMVSFLKVDHAEVMVTNDSILTYCPEVLWHCEKPVLRTAPVPLFMLSQLVRQNDFKVVLTGEGADEVFGGYNIFRENKVRRFWAQQPGSKFRFKLIKRLYPYIFKDQRLNAMLKNFFGRGLDRTDDPLFSHLIRWENTSRIKIFFSGKLKSAIGSYNCFDDLKQSLPDTFNEWDNFSKAQYLEMLLFMSNYLLSSQGDRMSMAHSVEIRLPYLDHRIIEFMSHVPSKWKIRGMNEKYILKRSFQGLLPDTIINRQKHPFRAPIIQSLLNEKTQEILSDRNFEIEELFDTNGVRTLFKKLKTARYLNEVDNMLLTGILSSHLIHEQFILNFADHTHSVVSPNIIVDKRNISDK